jgi:uncharacterized protein YkwD
MKPTKPSPAAIRKAAALLQKTVRRLVLLAIAPAAFLGALAVATPASAAPVPWQTLQTEIVKWTNHQRARHGCRPVRTDNRLIRAARDHSAWMARTRQFSHTGVGGSTFVVRVKRAGYARPLSENIAYGYPTGAAVVNAWMKSPGHRRNLLNCRATTVGVGAVYASNGRPYYTHDFGY